MTNYNTVDVVRRSMDSILQTLDGLDYEIVVVDSASTDGSYEILFEYAGRLPHVRVLRRRCSRGIGWHTAFENSSGPLVALAACDTVYNRNWRALLDWFLREERTFGVSAPYTEVCPRRYLEAVGGWRDLNYWEDVDLRARLAAVDAWRDYPVVCGDNLKRSPGTTRIEKAMRLYRRMHDKMLVATWLPIGIYLRGYVAAVRSLGVRVLPRLLYYLGLLVPAAFVVSVRRRRFRADGGDPTVLSDPKWRADLGLVPPEQLDWPAYEYDTREGCEAALRRGDYTFLPGFYD